MVIYYLALLVLAVFSYGLVDANFPIHFSAGLFNFVHEQRVLSAAVYTSLLVIAFGGYIKTLFAIKTGKLALKPLILCIVISAILLFFSFPGISNDIFNYIATAKLTYFYQENPYLVMPLEINHEPLLQFMHAANKTALYGPSWILLTFIPHFFGGGNLLLTIFTFKAFVACFYFGICWLIWQLSGKKLWSLAFFALNPLVLTETFIAGHNDVVMLFFALLAFYFWRRKFWVLAFFSLAISILVKFATIFLLPLFLWLAYTGYKKQKISWQKVWFYAALSMLAVFLLAPFREELYAWYFIWVLVFAAFSGRFDFWTKMALALSLALPLRLVPWLYSGSWAGMTPLIKKVITLVPPLFVFLPVLKKRPAAKTSWLVWFLLAAIFVRLILISPSRQALFSRNYNFKQLEDLYNNSQYVQKNPVGSIPDNAAYRYAAGYYLRGGSPILVNADQPPAGKYLMAASIVLFGNTTFINYLVFLLTILVFFLLSYRITARVWLSLLAVLLFLFEKTFVNQLVYSGMLDIFQLFFILSAFYFFIVWLEKKRLPALFLALVCLGMVAAVKFFITAVVMLASWLVLLFLRKQFRQAVVVAGGGFLAAYSLLFISYFRVFLEDLNPLRILSIQKWIFAYHSNKMQISFDIWPLIYFNRWQTWWGDFRIIADPQWSPLWPIIFTLAFAACALYFFQLKNGRQKGNHWAIEVIISWFLTYSVFISFGQANIRYLIPVLPFAYLLLLVFFQLLKNGLSKKEN